MRSRDADLEELLERCVEVSPAYRRLGVESRLLLLSRAGVGDLESIDDSFDFYRKKAIQCNSAAVMKGDGGWVETSSSIEWPFPCSCLCSLDLIWEFV